MTARCCLPVLTAGSLLLFLAPGSHALSADPAGKSPVLATRPVTIRSQAIPLSKALEQLKEQSGNAVVDGRLEKPDIPLKLNIEAAPFWPALDAIARAANLRLSLYSGDRRIALVEGPYREVPVSYSGPFRIALKKLTAIRDLDADEPLGRSYSAYLEVAWEPRFQAFLLENKPAALLVKDDKGNALPAPETGKGQIAVGGQVAVLTEEIRLPVLPRSTSQLGLFQGTLSLIGAPRMLTFDFDLGKFDRKTGLTQGQDGVSVTLNRLNPSEDSWTIGFSLKYPAGGPKLESYQSSLSNNKIYLVKARGGQRFPHNGGEFIDSTGSLAETRYTFQQKKPSFILGKPADWRVVYQTPAPIVEVPIRFEFAAVSLP